MAGGIHFNGIEMKTNEDSVVTTMLPVFLIEYLGFIVIFVVRCIMCDVYTPASAPIKRLFEGYYYTLKS